MRKTELTDAEPRMSTASSCRSVTRSLGIESFEWNYFRVEPGQSLSVCYHAHPEEEELFYVMEGTLCFETEEGDRSVRTGEVVRFEPGEFQHGYNDTDSPVEAMAFSAPREYEVSGVIECPECGEVDQPNRATSNDGTVRIFTCAACGAEVSRKTRS